MTPGTQRSDVDTSYLVVVDSDAELVVELERLSPDHASEPEAVVAVDHLGLCTDV